MIAVEQDTLTAEALLQNAHRQLVQRILASTAFAKSKRLSSLFEYVCDRSLSGHAYEINEQTLGEAVFGRPRGYDSSIDGIVRTQASRLRQRLDRYFHEEGVDEPVRITIPRGSYVPVFEQRSRPLPVPTEPLAVEAKSAIGKARVPAKAPRPAWLAWTLVSLLAMLLAVVVVRDLSKQDKASLPTLTRHLLWGPIFLPGQQTLLVPGDSSLVIWEGLKNRNIDLAEYVSGTYRSIDPAAPSTQDNVAARLATARYTSIVDLEVAQALSEISRSLGSGVEVRYPREVRPNDLKQGNLILVGASEADPWVTLFERNMNFVFFDDRERHVFSVLNRSPRKGEPNRWDSVGVDKEHRVYAVVAYVPNLAGNGNVLILEGTTMAGTECAWDFVSDDSKLMPFLQTIRKPDGAVPYFEVVLGTNNINGSAVEGTILASRVE